MNAWFNFLLCGKCCGKSGHGGLEIDCSFGCRSCRTVRNPRLFLAAGHGFGHGACFDECSFVGWGSNNFKKSQVKYYWQNSRLFKCSFTLFLIFSTDFLIILFCMRPLFLS